MADAVYKGVINGLNDTYAAYYTSDEYKDIMEKTQGSYCGIGAYVSADQDSGAITIVKPMKDSPCEKAGAKAGDIIYSVDRKRDFPGAGYVKRRKRNKSRYGAIAWAKAGKDYCYQR